MINKENAKRIILADFDEKKIFEVNILEFSNSQLTHLRFHVLGYVDRTSAQYALDGDIAEFVRKISRLKSILIDLYASSFRYPRNDDRMVYDSYSINDFILIGVFLILSCVLKRDEIVDIYTKTNYGEYSGKIKVLSVESCIVRFLRNYFMRNLTDCGKELEMILLGGATRDNIFPPKNLPKQMWVDLLQSLITKNSSDLIANCKKQAAWYKKYAKQHSSYEGTYGVDMMFNYVLMLVLKIGCVYENIIPEMEFDFVDWRLINRN